MFAALNFKTKYNFPNPRLADSRGLLAIGGDLSVARLQEAYCHGIFPWFSEGQPVLWWSPDPRMVLFPEKLRISKSMQQLFNQNVFEVTFDQCFDKVIRNCAEVFRPGQDGTWITANMIRAYEDLHDFGLAHSVEVWQDKKLVGGLYGIYLKNKNIFCGESMFSKVSNASKYGFITLVQKLQEEDIRLIDCQVHTNHLESLGAELISRNEFLGYL